MLNLLLRTEARTRDGDGGLATGAVMPVLQPRWLCKPGARLIYVCKKDSLALDAGHRDSVAFIEVQFVRAANMVQWDESFFFDNPSP